MNYFLQKTGYLVIGVVLSVSLVLSLQVVKAASKSLDKGKQDPRFMFVQTADSGTLTKIEGTKDTYLLKLQGVSPQTIAFSDRPERIVVQAPNQKFLDGMCFKHENPPNVAINILAGDEDHDMMVMDITKPVYDAQKRTLQYTVKFLEKPDHSVAFFNEKHDQSLPERFDDVALFIDDCKKGYYLCIKQGKHVWNQKTCGDSDKFGCCWDWGEFQCDVCHPDKVQENCKEKYGDECSDYNSGIGYCYW